jgi:type 1 glutamine amidotransferase
MNRREMLASTGLALAGSLGGFPLSWAAPAEAKKQRILMYTRSQGFEHGCVRRPAKNKLSLAEQLVTDLGAKHGFEAVCEKDGRIFLSKEFPTFAGFLFETQGDLLSEKSRDGFPPMTAAGKAKLLEAVAGGKGFVGCHCASDTFHSRGPRNENQPAGKRDPYISMLGGEFISHGAQQKGWMRVVDNAFPGSEGLKDFELREEWYALKNFAPDLHVILVQDTEAMEKGGGLYARPSYPATWARMHHKGRVFYTSMGHRDDVWKNPIFQRLLSGALSWTLGNASAKVTPNLEQTTPKASILRNKS